MRSCCTFETIVGQTFRYMIMIVFMHTHTFHSHCHSIYNKRLSIRIMLMIPIYAFASFVSLSSRHLSFYIDLIRDIYEVCYDWTSYSLFPTTYLKALYLNTKAFVIYTFFSLLVNYLGGERELLLLLDDRLATSHFWPLNLYLSPVDMSDPNTFLWIRRGVLQFVIVKPILSIFITMFKIFDLYHEGYVSVTSVSII